MEVVFFFFASRNRRFGLRWACSLPNRLVLAHLCCREAQVPGGWQSGVDTAVLALRSPPRPHLRGKEQPWLGNPSVEWER